MLDVVDSQAFAAVQAIICRWFTAIWRMTEDVDTACCTGFTSSHTAPDKSHGQVTGAMCDEVKAVQSLHLLSLCSCQACQGMTTP